MFVPQTLPLYALVEGDSKVYMVVGWKATDTRWSPYLIVTGGSLNENAQWLFGAETAKATRCAFYNSRMQAESALLAH